MMERRRKKNIMLKTYLMINKIFYHKEKLEKTVRVKIKKKKNIVMKNKTIKRRKNQINQFGLTFMHEKLAIIDKIFN